MSKKLKIGLLGAGGRMGLEIQNLILQIKDFELVYAPSSKDVWNDKLAKNVEVWIDFTNADAFKGVLKKIEKYNRPLVSGTTGISASDKKVLNNLAKKIPVLWATNMSVGVAVLNEALKVFSEISDFDFQIEEIHHNRKKDAPSGTAITLKENLEKAIDKKIPDTLSIRGGGVFGVHKIYALSDEEVLTFEHSALNRTVFAKGALRAARWLAKNKKPGLYKISDAIFGRK